MTKSKPKYDYKQKHPILQTIAMVASAFLLTAIAVIAVYSMWGGV